MFDQSSSNHPLSSANDNAVEEGSEMGLPEEIRRRFIEAEFAGLVPNPYEMPSSAPRWNGGKYYAPH